MKNVYIGLTQGFMVDRLISNVRAMRTRSVYAAYTDNKHDGIIDDLLARKWGIGIDKANNTLEYTTQDNVRSALIPLNRWYRTQLLSQRLHTIGGD